MFGMLKYLPLALDPKNWRHAVDDLRLSYELMRDPRVPLQAKAVPALATLYVLSPIDLIPGWILFLGQLDDLAVMLVAVQAFKRMVPPEVLAEHQARLGIAAEGRQVLEG